MAHDMGPMKGGEKGLEKKEEIAHEVDHAKHVSHEDHHLEMINDLRKRFWICLVLTIPIMALSPMIQSILGIQKKVTFPYSIYILLFLASFVFFYGGKPFIKGFFDELAKKQPGMMTLIAIAITVAYVYSTLVVLGVKGKVFFWELSTLIDIMLLGHFIEMKSIVGASKALYEIVKLLPSYAHLLKDDGSIEDIPLDNLKKGDRFVVKPGEKIPTDGIVIEGHSNVDESVLTGESHLVHKMAGSKVIGGAINGDGSITVKVEKIGNETFLSQVLDMVKKAQETKSKTQNLANRAAFWLTIIAISTGSITLAVWLFLGKELSYAIERMVTVMVITCPHALGLAVPLVVAVTTSIAARHGLLLRNRTAFENSRFIDAVVFDKTGTLTEGNFGIKAIISLSDRTEEEILKIAASLEAYSEHPIGRGILSEAKKRSISIEKVEDFKAIKGKGVLGNIREKRFLVVSPNYLNENSFSINESSIKEHYQQGRTVVFVLEDDHVLGAIAVGDTIRKESKEAINTLHKMGIRCLMLTGDRLEVAKAVATTLNLDDYFAEVPPDYKADKIKELMAQGLKVAMTGDGINDAPALATANLGIAIGAGSDVAVETADVILVKSNPKDVVSIFHLARATYKKMVQNLLWATGYNIFAIPLAAGVLATKGFVLSPAIGAILMSISTVVVAINAKLVHIKN
ncbi:MAG: copper-translocating P-type ATPase [Deltaproteobacteria bacterium]|nr:copper-translocating P-type ATPase [Deltaproteobacteria bacterium]